MCSGSLTVVGTGIKFVGHITIEARAYIEQADKVLFGVADAATKEWIKKLNPRAESFPFYIEGKPRRDTYNEWVEQMLACVREGLKVCVVFYGHPGVFVYPSHEAIRRARLEGFSAQMLPGISAEDCLFADLGVDPVQKGCQSFEATDFLIRRRKFDTSSVLIVWQIGMVGELGYKEDGSNLPGLRMLIEALEKYYGSDHEVVVYEAAQYPIFEPVIQRVPLTKVLEAEITKLSTLYIPPKTPASLDLEMLDRLGIPRSQAKS